MASNQALRQCLAAMTKEMGVAEPDRLADGLSLLMEGAFITSQVFGAAIRLGRARCRRSDGDASAFDRDRDIS